MKKKPVKIICFFLFILCVIGFSIFLHADEKSSTPKMITVRDLPYKISITDNYVLLLTKSFDSLSVIEIYGMDIYSKKDNNIVFSESWSAKQLPNKEFSFLDESKVTMKSEQSITYENNVAFYFVTVKFYFFKIDEQKSIAEFVYRKMY